MFSITKKQASRWILVMSILAVVALGAAAVLLVCGIGCV